MNSTSSLECPVCWTVYRDPKVLPTCGHSVCGECVTRLVSDSRNGRSAACPECRQVSHLPPAKDCFPTNYRLADLVEQMAKTGVDTCSSCLRKLSKADLFTCGSCDAKDAEGVVVCGTCAVRAHQQHALDPYSRATQRDIEEARRTVEDRQAKAIKKAEEATSLIDKLVDLAYKVLTEELSALDVQRTRLDAYSDGTKDELDEIVQASAQTFKKAEEAVTMMKLALNGLIRQLEGGANDDILDIAFDEDVDFASDSGSDDEEELFFSWLYDGDEDGLGRRNEENSTASS